MSIIQSPIRVYGEYNEAIPLSDLATVAALLKRPPGTPWSVVLESGTQDLNGLSWIDPVGVSCKSRPGAVVVAEVNGESFKIYTSLFILIISAKMSL